MVVKKKPVGKIGGNKINGNVDSKEVKSKIKYITPVSGDIGLKLQKHWNTIAKIESMKGVLS